MRNFQTQCPGVSLLDRMTSRIALFCKCRKYRPPTPLVLFATMVVSLSGLVAIPISQQFDAAHLSEQFPLIEGLCHAVLRQGDAKRGKESHLAQYSVC